MEPDFLFVYALLRLQHLLPWNPQGFAGVEPHTAFNIAVSFATNTNWQNYAGETTLSYFTQMVALTSAKLRVRRLRDGCAGGARAWSRIAEYRHHRQLLGGSGARGFTTSSFPLSILLTVVLVSQGVIQNLDSYRPVAGSQLLLPMGPAASQIAIKQLGTNGGGFFNVNSAHPFENPTPVSNFAEMLALLLIPAALCYTFGRMVNDRRQGWALLAAMLILFVPRSAEAARKGSTSRPAEPNLACDHLPCGRMCSRGPRESGAGPTSRRSSTLESDSRKDERSSR